MERFKIDHFERVHGVGSFPEFRSLSPAETAEIRKQLARLLGVPESTSRYELILLVANLGQNVMTIEPEKGASALIDLFNRIKISTQGEIYINWRQFDDIDQMSTDNFTRYFSDVWYPSADDIDIFDSSMTWIISIRHDGCINLLVITDTITIDSGTSDLKNTSQFVLWLLEEVPELRPVFQEHLKDNREILSHVFMGDVSRFVVQAAVEGEVDVESPLARILRFIDRHLVLSDETIQELLVVSFVENIAEYKEALSKIDMILGPNVKEWLIKYDFS